MSEPLIVCVLGMHRSGTSLVARLLHALGLDLGPREHLMPASADNPAGHWEHEPIQELNDEILLRLGGTWSQPPELAAGWESRPELDELRHRAREVIEADFSTSDRWGFKDPRSSLTLPFWQRLLPPMRYVMCLRNPVDVAFSLKAREDDSLEFEQGVGLWLTYVTAALAATAARPLHMVFYEDLMADPEHVVRQLASFVGMGRSEGAEAYIDAAIRVALSESLWHHRTAVPNVIDEPRLPFPVKALYLALRLFSMGPECVGVEALDLLGGYAIDADRQRADIERRLSERRADLERATKSRTQSERRRQQLEAKLQVARGSLDRAIESRTQAEHGRQELQAKLEVARGDLERVTRSRTEAQQRRQELEAILEVARADLDRAIESRDEAQRRAQELEAMLEVARADLDRAIESRDEAQRRGQELEAKLSAAQRRSDELKAERDAACKELERLRDAPSEEHDGATRSGPRDAYEQLVEEVRSRALELIPSGATVLVASKGDDQLLELGGRRGLHFPIGSDGRYLGYHPPGDTAVIAQLEAMRARGADHLLLPATSLWWLEHYHGLRRHLEDRYAALFRDETCAIYALHSGRAAVAEGWTAPLKQAVDCLRVNAGRTPSVLDWRTGMGVGELFSETPVFAVPGEGDTLPYLDRTFDIVMLASPDPSRLTEARRVAASSEVTVDPATKAARVDWLPGASSGWGVEASVVLIPDNLVAPWEATITAFSESLDGGFAGELCVIGASEMLARARAAAGGARLRLIEDGGSVAQRARAAAKASNRRVLVFVTAPAVPLPDWLPSILALFSRDRRTGVVGTRILSPTGSLEEAGGVLDAGGSLRRRGNGDLDPDRPEYHFVKRVDFCSQPLLATRKDLFRRLGGLDGNGAGPTDPIVDFSLRAGQKGSHTYYQPDARVVTIAAVDP